LADWQSCSTFFSASAKLPVPVSAFRFFVSGLTALRRVAPLLLFLGGRVVPGGTPRNPLAPSPFCPSSFAPAYPAGLLGEPSWQGRPKFSSQDLFDSFFTLFHVWEPSSSRRANVPSPRLLIRCGPSDGDQKRLSLVFFFSGPTISFSIEPDESVLGRIAFSCFTLLKIIPFQGVWFSRPDGWFPSGLPPYLYVPRSRRLSAPFHPFLQFSFFLPPLPFWGFP